MRSYDQTFFKFGADCGLIVWLFARLSLICAEMNAVVSNYIDPCVQPASLLIN